MTARGRVPDPPIGAEFVVRPSLWASLDVLAKLILGSLPIVVPLLLSGLFQGAFQGVVDLSGPLLLVLVENVNLLFGLLVAFAPAVRLAFTHYIVDEEGIRVRTQILTRSEQRVQWDKVTALRHQRTVVDRVLGIERLDVVAWGARGATLKLVGLRNVAPLRDLVARRMRETATVEALARGPA